MLRNLLVLMLVIMLSLWCAAAFAEGNSERSFSTWSVSILKDLFKVTEDNLSLLNTGVLSPDGKTVVWGNGRDLLCFYDLDEDRVVCYPTPEQLAIPHYFVWSPDSQTIAFSEDLFRYLNESDIWMVNAATGSFTDCTDDGVIGGFPTAKDPYWLDYLPNWDPITTDLLFFRSEKQEAECSLELRSLNPDLCTSGQLVVSERSKQIVDLTGQLAGSFPIHRQPAISPDGSRMAVIVTSDLRDDPQNGIWMIDLIEESICQIATLEAFAVGFPSWHDTSSVLPEQISWTAEGEGLVVFLHDVAGFGIAPDRTVVYLDADTSEIHPLISWKGFDTGPDFYRAGEDGHTGVFRMARQAILMSDRKTLITVHHEYSSGLLTFIAQTLPPDASEPSVIGEIPFDERASGHGPGLVLASQSNVVLLFNRYLVSFNYGG